ncbi:hypothetical protein ACLB2K_043388 [Fragaria x ananassa]
MTKMFSKLLGIIMEIYVDDMLVKSLTTKEHVENLETVFEIILQYRMRLNLQKCLFGVVKGKYLGHVIIRQGLEANPEKIQAILGMKTLRLRNEVQSLTEKVVALARFVSRLTDKCTPFFKLLKSQRLKEINWGPEQDKAFARIKEYLMSAPILSKPVPGEMLYLYIAASATTVSSTLIRNNDGLELPVFYARKDFMEAESRYPNIEKLALALIIISRHTLSPYTPTILYGKYCISQKLASGW